LNKAYGRSGAARAPIESDTRLPDLAVHRPAVEWQVFAALFQLCMRAAFGVAAVVRESISKKVRLAIIGPD
jgi:hypothetical protein